MKTPRENVWICENPHCGAHLLTVDVAHGNTPELIVCQAGCGGPMRSQHYPSGPKPDTMPPEALYEWYRPFHQEYRSKRRDKKIMDYLDNGGLLMRPRTDATPIYQEDVEPLNEEVDIQPQVWAGIVAMQSRRVLMKNPKPGKGKALFKLKKP